MTTVLKSTVRMRIAPDIIITHTFEHFVDNEDDARELGKNDYLISMAYSEGYIGSE